VQIVNQADRLKFGEYILDTIKPINVADKVRSWLLVCIGNNLVCSWKQFLPWAHEATKAD